MIRIAGALLLASFFVVSCASPDVQRFDTPISVHDPKEQDAIDLFHMYGMNGYPRDYEKASAFFASSAAQGYAKAQYNLGVNYERGLGVPEDAVKAAEWYLKAAEQGHAEAQYNLGIFYQKGVGVPQDEDKAMYWLQKSAEQGYAPAKKLFSNILRDTNNDALSRLLGK
jgi:TPR repeat protein